MLRTKHIFQEVKEEEYFNDNAFLQAEREYEEQKLMQELYETKIIIGEGRKKIKGETYGRVERKLPRIIKSLQSDNGRVYRTGEYRFRFKPTVSSGVF